LWSGWIGPNQAPKKAGRCGGGPSPFELAENIERVDVLSYYMNSGLSIRAMYGFGVVRLELGAVFGITKAIDRKSEGIPCRPACGRS
jgi:hypothetical protein